MRMKTRVTLTLEPRITHQAKSVARQRGTSLSGLVDQLLAKECGEPPKESEIPFHRKWGGKLRISDQSGPRFDYLKKKYAL
mgnify:CR=1 FL=1